MVRRRVTPLRGLPLPLALLLLLPGCGKGARELMASRDASAPTSSLLRLAAHLRPAGADRFVARFDLTTPGGAPASGVEYALDPPAQGDTTWQSAPAGPLALTLDRRPGQAYVLVARTRSGGAVSPTERVAFTADDVLAQATIVSPPPTTEVAILTPTAFTVRWMGSDPEAPGGVPSGYLTRLVRASDINPDNPNAVTSFMVQHYFATDLATSRAAWTQTVLTSQALSNLATQTNYYFAVSALDAGGAPGASDTTFDGNRNVLAFHPSVDVVGPKLTVFNALFSRTKNSVSLDPAPLITLQIGAGEAIPINWFADPRTLGSQVTGYRWAIDLADVADESPRRNANDLAHWSEWSLTTTSTTAGPFHAGDVKKDDHRVYIEARDNFGDLNLFVVELDVIARPRPARDLLLVDDMYGTPTDRNPTPPYVSYSGPWPMEAEQDSFYNARGGFPDSLRILAGQASATSLPGCFADFAYDTLDYRAWPMEGIALSTLLPYRVVAWYTDQASTANSGAKFGSARPATAIRFLNSVGHQNTLAEYLKLGGKAWLFGDGTTTAIANGYYSRIQLGAVPRLPYMSGDDPRADVLVPGDFLYDFVHLRSSLDVTQDAASALTNQLRLAACIPYLPQYALPPGEAPPPDRSLDPRIGPSAARNVARWSGLPRLTVAAFRGVAPGRTVGRTWVVTSPLSIVEGRKAQSVLDTLYLAQAALYDPADAQARATDGRPNAIDYHGSDNGEVVWFGFPLYDFEPDQARQATRVVLTNLGLSPAAPGAAGAHPATATVPAKGSGTVSVLPQP